MQDNLNCTYVTIGMTINCHTESHAGSKDCHCSSFAFGCLLKKETKEAEDKIIQKLSKNRTYRRTKEKKKQKNITSILQLQDQFLDCKVISNQLEILILFLCINLAD